MRCHWATASTCAAITSPHSSAAYCDSKTIRLKISNKENASCINDTCTRTIGISPLGLALCLLLGAIPSGICAEPCTIRRARLGICSVHMNEQLVQHGLCLPSESLRPFDATVLYFIPRKHRTLDDDYS